MDDMTLPAIAFLPLYTGPCFASFLLSGGKPQAFTLLYFSSITSKIPSTCNVGVRAALNGSWSTRSTTQSIRMIWQSSDVKQTQAVHIKNIHTNIREIKQHNIDKLPFVTANWSLLYVFLSEQDSARGANTNKVFLLPPSRQSPWEKHPKAYRRSTPPPPSLPPSTDNCLVQLASART